MFVTFPGFPENFKLWSDILDLGSLRIKIDPEIPKTFKNPDKTVFDQITGSL